MDVNDDDDDDDNDDNDHLIGGEMDGGAAARGGETRRWLPWKRFLTFGISLTSAFLSLLRTVAIASIEWENP